MRQNMFMRRQFGCLLTVPILFGSYFILYECVCVCVIAAEATAITSDAVVRVVVVVVVVIVFNSYRAIFINP